MSEEYAWHDKLLYWALLALVAGAFVFMFYYMDKNPDRIATAMRVKTIQLFNVALVWVPVWIFDKVTPGHTLMEINKSTRDAAIFYGLMALASSVVVAWGSV